MAILWKMLGAKNSLILNSGKSWDKEILSFLEDVLMLQNPKDKSFSWIRLFHSEYFKYFILAVSIGVSLFLEWYFHSMRHITVVYTHLFYIPIIIASIYYGFKGGLYSSLFLALAHNQLFFGGVVPELVERGLMIVVIGATSGYAIQLLAYFIKNASQTQEMYKDLVENMSMPAIIIQIGTGILLFANRTFTDLTTIKTNGKAIQWKKFIHPDDMDLVERVRAEFRDSKIAGKTVECRLLDKNGISHNMIGEATKLPFFNTAILCLKDVTENKKLKSETVRTMAMFEELYENAPSALLLISPESRIIKHNKRFRELFGIPESIELEGSDLGSVIPGGDILDTFLVPSEGAAIKGPLEKEFIRKTWNGEGLPMLGTLVPFDFEGEKCFFIAFQDLRELKNLAAENRQKMEMFKGLFENSPAALVLMDSEKRILDANREFLEVFQINDKEDIRNKNLVEIVLGAGDKDLKQQCSEIHAKSIEEGYAKCECLRRRSDGELIPVEVREVRVPYRSGYASLVHYINLTEQKDREEKLQNAYYHLSHTTENLIFTASNIIESRDPYTSGHQKRVAELSKNIATELGLDSEEVRGIYFAGLLHDMGKIRIPAEILSKPGKLTDVEMELVRIHPETGSEILKDIPFPWPVKDMVRHHHERLDGSGYPDGLKGESISIGTKILAVADVVEAMMNHRPYRASLGMDVALDEIKKGAGTLYDPKVVDTCVSLFTEKGFAFD